MSVNSEDLHDSNRILLQGPEGEQGIPGLPGPPGLPGYSAATASHLLFTL